MKKSGDGSKDSQKVQGEGEGDYKAAEDPASPRALARKS